MTGYDVG